MKRQLIGTSTVTFTLIYFRVMFVLTAVQVMMHLGGKVIQIVWFWKSCRGRVDVDEQTSAEAQRVCLFLQGAQHPLRRERRADDPRWKKLMAAAAVMGQIAAVAAAESTEITLVRLLPRV